MTPTFTKFRIPDNGKLVLATKKRGNGEVSLIFHSDRSDRYDAYKLEPDSELKTTGTCAVNVSFFPFLLDQIGANSEVIFSYSTLIPYRFSASKQRHDDVPVAYLSDVIGSDEQGRLWTIMQYRTCSARSNSNGPVVFSKDGVYSEIPPFSETNETISSKNKYESVNMISGAFIDASRMLCCFQVSHRNEGTCWKSNKETRLGILDIRTGEFDEVDFGVEFDLDKISLKYGVDLSFERRVAVEASYRLDPTGLAFDDCGSTRPQWGDELNRALSSIQASQLRIARRRAKEHFDSLTGAKARYHPDLRSIRPIGNGLFAISAARRLLFEPDGEQVKSLLSSLSEKSPLYQILRDGVYGKGGVYIIDPSTKALQFVDGGRIQSESVHMGQTQFGDGPSFPSFLYHDIETVPCYGYDPKREIVFGLSGAKLSAYRRLTNPSQIIGEATLDDLSERYSPQIRAVIPLENKVVLVFSSFWGGSEIREINSDKLLEAINGNPNLSSETK